MWPFSTIRFVTLPTLFGVAPRLMMLGTYVAFQGDGTQLFGLNVPALALATAVFAVTLVLRNALLHLPKPEQAAEWIALLLSFGILVGILWLVFQAEFAASVQRGWTAYLVMFAFLYLVQVRLNPENLHKMIPSGRPSSSRHLPRIFEFLAYGYVLRAATGEALARWGSEQAWVLFMTLGSIALEFLINWVIVLAILARNQDD